MSNRDFVKGECRQCAGHLEFPADAIGQTVPCPHCGQTIQLGVAGPPRKSRQLRRWRLIIVVSVCFVAIGLTGLFLVRQRPMHKESSGLKTASMPLSNTPALALPRSAGLQAQLAENSRPAPAASQPAVQVKTNEFAILPFKLEQTPGSSLVYVTGTIRNLSDRQRFGVKVQFGLLDANEAPIGLATDYALLLHLALAPQS